MKLDLNVPTVACQMISLHTVYSKKMLRLFNNVVVVWSSKKYPTSRL